MTLRSFAAALQADWQALAFAAASIAVLLKFSSIVPPWPDEGGVGASAFAVACCVVGIASGYHVSFRTKRRQRYVGLGAIASSILVVLVYVYVYSSRVAVITQAVNGVEVSRRIVVGSELQKSTERHLSVSQLIELHGFEGEIWTRESLTVSRMALWTTYGGIYIFLTFGLGCLKRLERPS